MIFADDVRHQIQQNRFYDEHDETFRCAWGSNPYRELWRQGEVGAAQRGECGSNQSGPKASVQCADEDSYHQSEVVAILI